VEPWTDGTFPIIPPAGNEPKNPRATPFAGNAQGKAARGAPAAQQRRG